MKVAGQGKPKGVDSTAGGTMVRAKEKAIVSMGSAPLPEGGELLRRLEDLVGDVAVSNIEDAIRGGDVALSVWLVEQAAKRGTVSNGPTAQIIVFELPSNGR